MAIDIVPLAKSDIPEAVECIQTVFADDPFFQYMFDPNTYNIARNAGSLRAHFLHGLSINAPIYIARETETEPNEILTTKSLDSAESDISDGSHSRSRIVGICWWHPPTPHLTLKHRTQDLLLSMRQLLLNVRYRGRGGLQLNRYKQWKKLQSQTHRRIWTDERGYYFCNVIAVRGELRGKGVGRRLVEAVTAQADEEGMSCYLESSKGMPNLRIYERLGFEGVCEIECFDGNGSDRKYNGDGEGVTLYCMIRKPATQRKDGNQC